MKRVLGLSIIIAILCLTMVVPIQAAGPVTNYEPGSQTWYLNSVAWQGYMKMQKGTSAGLTGDSVKIPSHGEKMWVADQVAGADVTFMGSGLIWPVSIHTVTSWNASDISCSVGDWNPVTNVFTPFEGQSFRFAKSRNEQMLYEVTFQVDPTITKGHYLALKLINNISSDRVVITDPGSYMSSPDSDPGYPLPEMVTGALLGLGLAGLSGYFVIRRKNAKASNRV